MVSMPSLSKPIQLDVFESWFLWVLIFFLQVREIWCVWTSSQNIPSLLHGFNLFIKIIKCIDRYKKSLNNKTCVCKKDMLTLELSKTISTVSPTTLKYCS